MDWPHGHRYVRFLQTKFYRSYVYNLTRSKLTEFVMLLADKKKNKREKEKKRKEVYLNGQIVKSQLVQYQNIVSVKLVMNTYL